MMKMVKCFRTMVGIVAVCAFLSGVSIAEAASNLAVKVWNEINMQCPQGYEPTYFTLELETDITAELIFNDCPGWCGSGGCSTSVIVKDRVYEVFGSKPFLLQGSLRGENVAVIGWFMGGSSCNDNVAYENCVFTMYWQSMAGMDSPGKLMRNGGREVTREYR